MTLQQRLEQIAKQRLYRDANEVRNEIIDQLSHPGTGRVYGNHQASAPGQSPAVDTGRLRQSIDIDDSKISSLKIRVGTNVQYAPALEYGSRTIAPRPFLRTAAERWRRSRGVP